MRRLREEPLFFDDELVSNYLLALQAKRFVILTGISGTGKTKLALAVARAFAPAVDEGPRAERPVLQVGEVEVEVLPYMTKYRRMILPASLTRLMTLPPVEAGSNSGMIDVTYPGGTAELRFWRDPNRNVTSLGFRGDFREWFASTFENGGRFILAPTPADDGPSGLDFRLPGVEEGSLKPAAETRPWVVAAVRPDWTDNRGLLGFYNPLTETYAPTPVLDLVIRADREMRGARKEGRRPQPFFLILDEMNLARVEHYFSDFLSCLESGEPIHLHDDSTLESAGGVDGAGIPRDLPIPANLFVVGTVNVDETTYMFSPKVLDRAFAVELNRVDLGAYGRGGVGGGDAGHLRLTRFDGQLLGAAGDGGAEPWALPSMGDWVAFGTLADGVLRQVVEELNEILAEEHRHFGYRVANEIGRFVNLASEQSVAGAEPLWAALDLAIMQKVLPKLHGTQQELGELLDELHGFTGRVVAPEDAGTVAKDQPSEDEDSPAAVPSRLPRTRAKLERMTRRLQKQGFTSFIE